MEKSNQVKSVLKSLKIIDLLSKHKELSISELSALLDMDKGTVHRLVSTLKEGAYVDQNKENKKYSNGLKLFEIGSAVARQKGVATVGKPYLKKLAEESGETINLGMLDGVDVLYMDKIESSETIRVDLSVGSRIPAYCTGLGKSIMAFLPKAALEEMIEITEIKKITPHTVESKSALYKQLETIKKNGFCIDDEEYVEGIVCFAAPIFNHNGYPIAAISVSMPKFRYNEGDKRKRYEEIITRNSLALSGKFGYNK